MTLKQTWHEVRDAMIDRVIEPRLRSLARQFPALVLTGPRQSGKSTVCQKVFAHPRALTSAQNGYLAAALMKNDANSTLWLTFWT
jgi:hypothetical protein